MGPSREKDACVLVMLKEDSTVFSSLAYFHLCCEPSKSYNRPDRVTDCGRRWPQTTYKLHLLGGKWRGQKEKRSLMGLIITGPQLMPGERDDGQALTSKHPAVKCRRCSQDESGLVHTGKRGMCGGLNKRHSGRKSSRRTCGNLKKANCL